MKRINFRQQRRNGAFIEDLDMLFYRVYADGNTETIKAPSVQDGLKEIPFIRPDVVLVKFTIPIISGYSIKLVEKSVNSEKATLVYVIR